MIRPECGGIEEEREEEENRKFMEDMTWMPPEGEEDEREASAGEEVGDEGGRSKRGEGS